MQTNLFTDPNSPIKSTADAQGSQILSLAEFPLAIISRRASSKLKTENILVVEDITRDRITNKPIHRKQTVTAGPLGLPTRFDDQVLVALMQISGENDYCQQEIYFTLYEIAKRLGITTGGKTTKRIKESLDRWLAITVYFENAWWTEDGGWISKSFHILQEFESRGKYKGNIICWSDSIFQTLKENQTGLMDWNTFLNLKKTISSQIYRLILTRFHHKFSRIEMDLVDFAHKKMGLEVSQPGKIKKQLTPALLELESLGLILGNEESHWYRKISTNKWEIGIKPGPAFAFTSGKRRIQQFQSPLIKELMKIGMSENKARKLTEQFTVDQIQAQIDYLHFRLKTEGSSVIKNPPAYLVTAIENQYGQPAGYRTKAQRQAVLEASATSKSKKAAADKIDRDYKTILTELRQQATRILDDMNASEVEALRECVIEQKGLASDHLFLGIEMLNQIIVQNLKVPESFLTSDKTFKEANGVEGMPELKKFSRK